jgi:competence protein ComEA
MSDAPLSRWSRFQLPALIALVVGAGLVVSIGWKLGNATPVPLPVASSTLAGIGMAPAETVTVYVSGAVPNPGLVEVPEGARVADAIGAIGGALSTADLGLLNLATVVRDGDHIVVPEIGSQAALASSSGESGVRVNIATAAELESLPGVGPTTAAKIVAYRQTNGPFGTVEDLLDVPGIGEGKLAGFRDQIIVP